MRTPRLTDERGMALAAAIFALVVIGALVAGAFYASTLEQRTGRNSMYAAEAAQAAETGPWPSWPIGTSTPSTTWGNGSTTSLGTTYMTGRTDMKYTLSATRLNDQLFLLTSLGTRVDPTGAELARSSVATLARLSFVSASAKAAVTVTKPRQVQRQRVQRDRERLACRMAGTRTAWATRTRTAPRARTRLACERHDDRRRQRRPGQPLRRRRRRWPTIRRVTSDFFNIFGDVTFDELKKNARHRHPGHDTDHCPPRTCSRRRRSAATSPTGSTGASPSARPGTSRRAPPTSRSSTPAGRR